jgi:hypothetical protein
MNDHPAERRTPGWMVLAVLVLLVGAAVAAILLGPRR